MNTAQFIAQLLQIEQAIGKIEPARIRGMVFEAEESILQIEQQMIEIPIENDLSLRQRMESSRPPSSSALTELATPRNSSSIKNAAPLGSGGGVKENGTSRN